MVLNDAPYVSPMLLKGKLTNRSWAQLPEEIIRSVFLSAMQLFSQSLSLCAPKRVLLIIAFARLIATYYLLDISVSNHCPSAWENRKLWPNKMVYTTIRDAFDVEKHLMSVCPEWHKASEYYPASSVPLRSCFALRLCGTDAISI
jgi:hypothetical protein